MSGLVSYRKSECGALRPGRLRPAQTSLVIRRNLKLWFARHSIANHRGTMS